MKLLITGTKGFTGALLQRKAAETGYNVFPLYADLTDKPSLLREILLIEPTNVIHLAAISFVGHQSEAAIYEVNVLGTQNLLEVLASLPNKPKKIILASSANVYGNAESSPIHESQPPAPTNHYAISKLAMEYLAATYADRLPIVITRPFNYTGCGQRQQFLIPKLVKHFQDRSAYIDLGNVNIEREFNDVRMVCEAYLRLLTAGQPDNVYNICSGITYSVREVIERLERITAHNIGVNIDPCLVRRAEVKRLCGCTIKLTNAVGQLPQYKLDDTLRWMLNR